MIRYLVVLFFSLIQSYAASITLMWNYSPSTNVTTYYIKYGTNSNIYFYNLNAGKTNSAVITNLTNTTWYFVVTAKDEINNIESEPSNEIWKYLGTNGIPPVISKGFSASIETSYDIKGPWRSIVIFATNVAFDAEEQYIRSYVTISK